MASLCTPISKGVLWSSLLIGLVASVCFLGYQRRMIEVLSAYLPRTRRAPALLEVDHQGTDLRVSWNHDVPAIALASSGLLSIRDGDTLHRELRLDNEQLRTGRMLLYSPSNHSVQVGLEVVGSTGQHARESVLVLSARDSAPPPNETASLVLVSSNGDRRVVSNAAYAVAGEPPVASKPSAPAAEKIATSGFVPGQGRSSSRTEGFAKGAKGHSRHGEGQRQSPRGSLGRRGCGDTRFPNPKQIFCYAGLASLAAVEIRAGQNA